MIIRETDLEESKFVRGLVRTDDQGLDTSNIAITKGYSESWRLK